MGLGSFVGSFVGSFAKGVLNASAVPVGAIAGFQTSLRIACHWQPMPMPHQFSGALDHPLRMGYRRPQELLAQCGVGQGETVVDLGCGTGTFTVEMARLVGETGTVHAVDVQPPLLSQTATRLASLNLEERTHLHLASAERLPLSDESVDMVTLIATIGEIADPLAAIDEIHRILKPGGRLVISEELPDPGYVSSPSIRKWLADAGFEFADCRGTLFCYCELYLRPLH